MTKPASTRCPIAELLDIRCKPPGSKVPIERRYLDVRSDTGCTASYRIERTVCEHVLVQVAHNRLRVPDVAVPEGCTTLTLEGPYGACILIVRREETLETRSEHAHISFGY